LYLLEIHEGTPLADQVRAGRRPMPDEDLAAEMYEMMLEELEQAGYRQYGISNFSKQGFESRHNTKYWRLDPVYGFGVSAHSFDGVERYSNARDTAEYVSMIEGKGLAEVMREAVDASSEYVFLGLRLNKGIDLKAFDKRFGVSFDERFPSALDELSEKDLVFIEGNAVRLTRKGMLFSNEVFHAFV
jgi:oxygen-independent coproporphyrinogen-3 oxidase